MQIIKYLQYFKFSHPTNDSQLYSDMLKHIQINLISVKGVTCSNIRTLGKNGLILVNLVHLLYIIIIIFSLTLNNNVN